MDFRTKYLKGKPSPARKRLQKRRRIILMKRIALAAFAFFLLLGVIWAGFLGIRKASDKIKETFRTEEDLTVTQETKSPQELLAYKALYKMKRAQINPVRSKAYVDYEYLDVFEGPDTSSRKVIKLLHNDSLNIVGMAGDWYVVGGSKEGLIFGGFVEKDLVMLCEKSPRAKSYDERPKPELPELDPDAKIIFLTFDDGPGKTTEKLLNILDKYQVKATFFVTNQFPKYQNLIGEEAKRGHKVAIHSYSHEYKQMYTSKENYYKDLEKMQKVIEEQTGKRADLVRFPAGSSNSVSTKYCKGLMTALTKELPAKGYEYTDWNVDSRDAVNAKTSAAVASNVIKGIQKQNHSVVLQHDIKGYSVDAVEEIIRWGLSNGYEFRTMEQNCVTKFNKIHN